MEPEYGYSPMDVLATQIQNLEYHALDRVEEIKTMNADILARVNDLESQVEFLITKVTTIDALLKDTSKGHSARA